MEDKFLFVITSDARTPKGRNYRRLIRRQAMQKAAASRRKEDTQRNHNRRQLPTYPQSTNPHVRLVQYENDVSDFGDTIRTLAQSRTFELCVDDALDPLSSTGYDALKIELDFDILDLSALTTFSVGRVAAHILARQPTLLQEVLRCRQPSYLSYIPCRIGHSDVLDTAIRCVVARARQCLQFPHAPPDRLILHNYVKAIQSLQIALNNEQKRMDPEVLCATQLLGIFEVCKARNIL